jgi:hypothetical protein
MASWILPGKPGIYRETADGAADRLEGMDRSHYPTRVVRWGEPEPADPVRELTAEQRLKMVWPLTLEAWRFIGNPVDGVPMRRDIVRVTRRPK